MEYETPFLSPLSVSSPVLTVLAWQWALEYSSYLASTLHCPCSAGALRSSVLQCTALGAGDRRSSRVMRLQGHIANDAFRAIVFVLLFYF